MSLLTFRLWLMESEEGLPMRSLVVWLLPMLVGFPPLDVHAQERIVPKWLNEVKIGLLHHDTGDIFTARSRERGVDFNLEAIFSPLFNILGGAIYPAFGGSLNTAGYTSKGYGGIRWQYEHSTGLFASVGFGGAVHSGTLQFHDEHHKALGSRILFHVPLELGYRFDGKNALSVYLDHISNANYAHPNEGMDTLGLRYGYRF